MLETLGPGVLCTTWCGAPASVFLIHLGAMIAVHGGGREAAAQCSIAGVHMRPQGVPSPKGIWNPTTLVLQTASLQRREHGHFRKERLAQNSREEKQKEGRRDQSLASLPRHRTPGFQGPSLSLRDWSELRARLIGKLGRGPTGDKPTTCIYF